MHARNFNTHTFNTTLKATWKVLHKHDVRAERFLVLLSNLRVVNRTGQYSSGKVPSF